MTSDLSNLIDLMKTAQKTGKTISQEDIKHEFKSKIILLTDEYFRARKLSPEEAEEALACVAQGFSAEIVALSLNKVAAIIVASLLCDLIMKTVKEIQ